MNHAYAFGRPLTAGDDGTVPDMPDSGDAAHHPERGGVGYVGLEEAAVPSDCAVVVIDETDRVRGLRRIPSLLPTLLDHLAPYRESLVGVVIESKFAGFRFVDGLTEAGYLVHLARPSSGGCYVAPAQGDEEWDAVYLAQLLRLGVLPSPYISPHQQRTARDISRRRTQLIRRRTACYIEVERILARHLGRRWDSGAVRRLSVEAVGRLGLPDELTRKLQAMVAWAKVETATIARLERRLRNCLQPRSATALPLVLSGPGQAPAVATVPGQFAACTPVALVFCT
jgi:transposase